MNVLSLFSGIGGLDLGLQRAGMTIAGQVEIDPWCRKVLAKHWPEVPRHDDVRTCVQWWGGRRAPDVVCGGFPCQPVSVAGRGLAQADSRWLWPAFADVIRCLRPRYVLVENVPGLLGRGMGDVLGDLASLGYDAEWDCVPAVFVGAPHIRNRVWIVAYPAGSRCASGTSGAGEPARNDTWRPRPDGLGGDVADAERVGRMAERGEYLAGGARETASQGRSERLAPSSLGQSGEGCQDVADADGAGSQDWAAASGRRPGATLRLESQRLGVPVADADGERRGNGPRVFRGVGTTGCGRWSAEPDVGRVAHGIPGRVDRLRGLGNAVVPQVAEHIGRMILAADAEAAA